jgi:hypothetical protein
MFSGMATIKVVAWFLLVHGLSFVIIGRQNLHHFFQRKRILFHSLETAQNRPRKKHSTRTCNVADWPNFQLFKQKM